MRVDLPNQIVLRWDSDSDCSGLLASGGIDAVWFPSHDDRIAAACRAAGADTLDADAIRFVGRDQTGPLPPGDFLAVKAGVWPGARASARNADGSFSGGASQRAWIDANGYLVAWTKALFPGRAPLLAYLPDSDAGIAQGQVITYDSLELALIDAWAAGGNYLLAPDAAYRNALLRRDPAATAAWSQLGPDRPLAQGEPGSSPPTSPEHHHRPGRTGRYRCRDRRADVPPERFAGVGVH
jgi:hypothetical protein